MIKLIKSYIELIYIINNFIKDVFVELVLDNPLYNLIWTIPLFLIATPTIYISVSLAGLIALIIDLISRGSNEK